MTRLVLFELFVTNLLLFEHQQKLLIHWRFSGTYGVTKYSSGWRKDVINQCLELTYVTEVYITSWANLFSSLLAKHWLKWLCSKELKYFFCFNTDRRKRKLHESLQMEILAYLLHVKANLHLCLRSSFSGTGIVNVIFHWIGPQVCQWKSQVWVLTPGPLKPAGAHSCTPGKVWVSQAASAAGLQLSSSAWHPRPPLQATPLRQCYRSLHMKWDSAEWFMLVYTHLFPWGGRRL